MPQLGGLLIMRYCLNILKSIGNPALELGEGAVLCKVMG